MGVESAEGFLTILDTFGVIGSLVVVLILILLGYLRVGREVDKIEKRAEANEERYGQAIRDLADSVGDMADTTEATHDIVKRLQERARQ
ncbi:hypothetical protein [Euzebya tangerina]|uniref:hypothetical protein n=1 Tax=Euzebya tangerina TaxID=591198 RepID=UPI000E321FCC|nr:hypothetical protein [Euzebya tangerina]